MLKHVHITPYRYKQQAKDAVSLSSTNSFCSSSFGGDRLSSRSSSSCSLADPRHSGIPKIVIKVFVRVLCANMEYKTLSICPTTTSKDVVKMLLTKFRMKLRDPNLFFLTMEIWMRQPDGLPIRTVLVLEDDARPAELQACHPGSDFKFALQMRRGGLVKVFDGCLMAGSLYRSVLVSERTTTEELIQLLLHCYGSKERPVKFVLYEVCTNKKYERKLHTFDYPLVVQREWPRPDHFAFQLRRNPEFYQRHNRGWQDTESGQTFKLYV